MSKQQMSRNKGTRQEDDNKSKECFDAIATGNPSINNSTRSTSHSKEKSSSVCMNSTKSAIVDDYVDSLTSGNFLYGGGEKLEKLY